MIVEASERFELPAPADDATALAFLRDPARSLAKVRFLRELAVSGHEVRGVLAVQLPMLGEVTLPFFSVLDVTPLGARLIPQALENERAWIEVGGEGQLKEAALAYVFVFRAHLQMPTAEKWGGEAFEKMVRAAASRTIARVAQELPRAVGEALEGGF
ncbi:DUF3809 domain-containing protein [Deinococcus detaillensis]|uniref:DUF3809 domain-containing protein n=1 Tax=Deinococcus detaillensis TaxID=2592048 RepID=A0A553V328_9DEIO|nr:DUF3809 domain-containing protein [Deinococcus detaillensis]TSA86832.1 DUF3809 domain-containing protein [Deinococcus detaillensis]